MIKIKFLSVGKTREFWLEDGLHEYMKRLSHDVTFDFTWLKDEEALEKAIEKEQFVILLDPHGKMMDSLEFADFLFKAIEEHNSRLSFAIGGPDGFSEAIKQKHQLVSFSRLTFTHQMIRVLLIEQIFRAFEIKKGSHYHK